MPSNYRRIYPSTGDATIKLDGGLNSYYPKTLILDNESPDCQNVMLDQGACATREGTTKLNTAAIATAAGDGLYTRHDNDGSETMVAFANGSAWVLSGTSFSTIGSAQSVFTAGVRVGAFEYENHIFVGNGGIIPYKYNGTDWTRHGVYPPTDTMTAATNSNGTLTGDYQYKVTFINSQAVESDVSPASPTFTAAADEVLVSSIPVAPQSWGVSSRYLYRTENGGTTFKRVTEITNNTATTYVDNSSDSELGVNAPTDQGVPPKWQFGVVAQDRLFVNDPDNKNYFWYTELGNPYVIKATNFEKVGDNSGDLLRALAFHNNSIYAFGDKSTTITYMPDTSPANWVRVVIANKFGSKSPFGIFDMYGRLFFPAVEYGKFVGFGALIGDTVEPDASLLTVQRIGNELKTHKLKDQMNSVVQNKISNISAITLDEKAYITVTYGSGNTTNNRVYVMNFKIDNLSKVQQFSLVPWTGIQAAQFTIYNNELYFISSAADGFVYKMNDGTYNDDGAAIDSYAWTKEFPGFKNEENFNKDFRTLNFLADLAGAYNMGVNVRVDSDSGDGDSYQASLDPDVAVWDVDLWDNADWGDGFEQKDIQLFLGGKRGKRIQFKFSNQNTADRRFKVHWLKFAYNLKGFR